MSADVLETIRGVLLLREEQISTRTRLDRIVRDSIDAIELIAVLSERYALRIEPEQLARFRTVADVVRHVEAHRGEARASDDVRRL